MPAGKRAELFNSSAFPPSLFSALAAARNTECVFIWEWEAVETETEGLGVSRSLQFGAVFSLFITPLSHMIQTYKPPLNHPVELTLIAAIYDRCKSKTKISLFIFYSSFAVILGEGEELVWRQLFGSCITAKKKTKQQPAKQKPPPAHAGNDPSHRPLLFSCYANETSQHVGKLATCQPDPNK